MAVIQNNKKAYFNYEIVEKVEAGIVLQGWQVKSIKAGKVSIKEAYVYIKKGEMFVRGMTVSFWPGMSKQVIENFKQKDIKLLVHKEQITKWEAKLKQQHARTIAPLKLFTLAGKIKLEIGLAKSKQKHDKRAKIKERDMKRSIERDLKNSKYF